MLYSRSSRRLVFCLLVMTITAGRASAECDLSYPALIDFDFAPQFIHVSSGAIDVTCTMVLSDAPSGAVNPICVFKTFAGASEQSCTGVLTSGTPQNGTFECAVTIPQYAESGVWDANLLLSDAAGNHIALSEVNLEALGHPTELTVTSNPSDVTGPTLTDAVLTPTVIDVSNGDETVTCDMTVTDFPAGVAEATCTLRRGQQTSCTATEPASGDRNSGVFSCDLTIPQHSLGGNWRADYVLLDQAGTARFANGPGQVSVTSSTPDVVVPTLDDFSFSPEAVGVGSFGETVTCDMVVSDALAGVKVATCTFVGPDGVRAHACSAETPVSGTPQDGTYRCSFVLPAHSEGGSWDASVTLEDRTTNVGSLAAADLAAAGFPDVLTVDCGIEQLLLQWDDDETLTWNFISGALQYNVYRGLLSDLPVDYGDCQNDRDPVLTDLMFAEPDIPPVGMGYQFLVSFTDESGEDGLGTATGGGARNVSTPCP